VLDDVGFGQLGCYGGLGARVETPNIDRLAASGIRYNNFHTTALCSPTRACLLTGRNHHSVGMGSITECATGYPGYNGRIPHEAAMLPAILVERGFNTLAFGKWHLAPDEHLSGSGPYDRWPLGRGFERFYGFLPGETDQFRPDLWQDNQRVNPPRTPEQGYHLSADLVDRALSCLNEQKAITPDKPCFMYLAFGACHAPHQAPRSYIERYKGRFDAGWDVVREETLAKQKEMGLVPGDTELPDRNPGVKAWDTLSDRERRVFCKQMEVYAAFLTYTDEQVGRLLDVLESTGQRENTMLILLSDNGASGEGGLIGLSSEMSFFNMAPESLEELEKRLDAWGMPGTHPHYAVGWAMAGNTPQRWYKQSTFEGGTRDPLIVSWPGKIRDRGTVRSQFVHATDLAPTILECVSVEMPTTVRGYPQMPIEGVSFAHTFGDASVATRKRTQYFEMLGHRAIWKDGWKAVTFHKSSSAAQAFGVKAPPRDLDFEADQWELYHLDEDFSEAHDLAQQHPEKLRELIATWWVEAGKYQVLPLDDALAARLAVEKPVVFIPRQQYTFAGPLKLVRSASPNVKRRSHSITAEVEVPASGVEGVIVSDGGPDGGYCLCIHEGYPTYISNYLGREHTVLRAKSPLPVGHGVLRVEFQKGSGTAGTARLFVNGRKADEKVVERTNPIVYAVAEGLEIGSDSTAPVWPEYQSPFRFTGTIRKVEVEIGKQHVELAQEQNAQEQEAKRAMLHQ
jgi:arylsulfatase A-like enzyme